MTIRFSCPNCGKRFKVAEEQAGRNGKCTCGAVVQIPPASSDIPDGITSPDKAQICTRCLKTIQAQSECLMIDGKVYCPECAHRIAQIKEDVQACNGKLDPDIIYFDREAYIRKSTMARVVGFSLGLIILFPFILIRVGIFPAIFITAFTAVGAIIMVKKGHEYDLKITKDKNTFIKAKKRVKVTSPKAKLSIVLIIVAFCIWISITLFNVLNKNTTANFIESLIVKHWKLKLILLVVNIPVFVLISRLMVGSWGKYWHIAKWHWVPVKSSFFIFFKDWHKMVETVSVDDLLQVLSVDLICLWVYLLQCMLVNLIL